ncbi:bifunctional diaminohydroxyphosphoribosylaminopyrimidine deaminase/5-amino-6-(5-phosphoribosylamino)uracil reductase RibD [Emticicia sp. BO119]|uniref:bifunctional diaminohydroxyphosphoribosylaminopyrimidine deaminase/5-amino-6-(5-phosphoribosylamino)uracil reductase RibD n=1 Tax=Emticicia sp. BO119 TaxID=2757768 RepID=UPI0015F124BE|nr:bifunctional diaminohydroxyphosphoribosylaminopyrimidine deaminase/5-amino-6-(5-phosphoribosylamino)uracil reductase RibD [Emticicia sp. BO119]MBA4852808.1 bifunctional diaminohydroxyphosphoribosylaminopyrimidine deaminase/5-amino-6-(5-phosphoribosylamino)uracil reductase RibD [Emticicia sp. BO119]
MEEKYMLRALQLAEIGRGQVSPNPMVGCVIVHNDQIIGEGWHQKYGSWHAEVNAVNSVQDQSKLAESTVYVTLEPCSHFGKTPPCADLLVRHEVKKVIICNNDPNPLVAGKGIAKLRAAGIEVEQGLLAEKGRILNTRFFTYIEKKHPYIILKWAETADGFIAGENYEPVKISNALSHKLAHKWRSEEDAIMVGTNTARYDNPKLNAREWQGAKNPIRIVVDRQMQLSQSLHLFDNTQDTWILNELADKTDEKNTYIKTVFGESFIENVLQELHQRKIQSVYVEGGTTLLQSFIKANLFDEIRIFRSPNQLYKGIAAPTMSKNVEIIEKQNLMGDELIIYKHR